MNEHLDDWVTYLASQLGAITTAKDTQEGLYHTKNYFNAVNKLLDSDDYDKRELSYSAVNLFVSVTDNYEFFRRGTIK